MRIALCTDGVFPHALGGMQRHSRLLAEHLARLDGVKVIVLHPHAESVFDPVLGIEEVRVPAMDPARLYLRELWRYSAHVSDALDRVAPDAILSQGFSVWKGIDRFTPRLVMMPHGLEMYQGLTWKDRLIGLPFRWLVRFVARRSSHVVSLGGKITGMLKDITAGSRTTVTVIPNAVELPPVAPSYPQRDGPLKLLFVGRFAFNKGIDVLLEAAKGLVAAGRAADFRFILAGDGPERARMEQQGLPVNVELAGKVDDARLEQLYAESHALVLPTRFEGMPTVVLEAMARSRPALVSDVGAAAELVDGANGWLLPPGDAAALLDALEQMAAASTDALRAMGEVGRSRVADRFMWPIVAERFLELARSVAR